MRHFIFNPSSRRPESALVKGCLYLDFACLIGDWDGECWADFGCSQSDADRGDNVCGIDMCSYRDQDQDECFLIDWCHIDGSGEGCFIDICAEYDTPRDSDYGCFSDYCGIDHGCQDWDDQGYCIIDDGCQGHDQALDYSQCPQDYDSYKH